MCADSDEDERTRWAFAVLDDALNARAALELAVEIELNEAWDPDDPEIIDIDEIADRLMPTFAERFERDEVLAAVVRRSEGFDG